MEWTPELDDVILELHTRGKDASEIAGIIPSLHTVNPIKIEERISMLDNVLRNLRGSGKTMLEIASTTGLDVPTVKFRLAALGVGVIHVVPKTEVEPDEPDPDTGWDGPLYQEHEGQEVEDKYPDTITVTLHTPDFELDPEGVLDIVRNALEEKGIDCALELEWTYDDRLVD